MTADYEIGLALPGDIPGILALQEVNLPDRGGSLSVRQTADWFRQAILDMPLIVARRGGNVVGYMVSASLAAKKHVEIIQAMMAKFPAQPDGYSYGPVCIAESERGRGLAGLMFGKLCARLPGRPAMTFIRSDNDASLRAHEKMGMRILGEFDNAGERYTALVYEP